jgi:hypothetical protein
MFFEIRQYPLKPGKRQEWVKLMDEVIIPYQQSKGMVVLGSWVDEENDWYFWIRRFEDEAEKERLYAAVYQTDYWRNEMYERVGELIDRSGIQVYRVQATPRSLLR